MLGQTLGKYQLTAHLGRGGMADVYQARQLTLGRDVAVKVIAPRVADRPWARERFEQEAKSAAGLRHPGILPIYDYDFDPASGLPYLVMQLAAGGSLARVLDGCAARDERLPLDEVARVVTALAEALGHAHAQGVVHRDVKPANLLRDETGHYLLADFGLALLLASPNPGDAGVLLGTPEYMAPEQVRGEAVDGRADLYALGVVLYQLLTGALPYQASSKEALALLHVSAPVPDPCRANPQLPRALAGVVRRCLAKRPGERYPSAGELLRAFQAALGQAAAVPRERPDVAGTAQPTAPEPPAVTLIPAPPEPSLPPLVGDIVGREVELARYFADLRQRRLAVVYGMPGAGKTALAAALAGQVNRPGLTFWHSLQPGEDVAVLIWKLAGFLAWHNQADVWEMLQRALQTGATAPPQEVLLDYLFEMLPGQGLLLCLDDLHHLDDDPRAGRLLARLLAAAEAGDVEVVLASQRRPDFAGEADQPLAGLSLADIHLLLQAHAVALPDESVQALHAMTEGNARLLVLAIEVLRQSDDPARQVARLAESDQIARFLIKEVDGRLPTAERRVMEALAVLLGQAGSRDAIAAVLDGESVRRTLSELASRCLVQSQEEEGERRYALNELVRGYYYENLHRRRRLAMHRRAAEYYASRRAPLPAAAHYQRVGEQALAFQLLAGEIWPILNQGQGQHLRLVLEQFESSQLEARAWISLLLARGQTLAFLGEPEPARASYEAALAQAAAPPGEADLLAQACLGLGELLQYDAPREAQGFLKRGLAAGHDVSARTLAALSIRLGAVHYRLGEAEAAHAALEAGQALLGPEPDNLRATALTNLGILCGARGDLGPAIAYFDQALGLYEHLRNLWGQVGIWHNLAYALEMRGRWDEAAKYYHKELATAEKLGSQGKLFNALLGLGILQHKQGDSEAAEQNLLRAVENARGRKSRGDLSYVLPVLAGVYLDTGRAELVAPLLTEAEEHVAATEVREPLPEIQRNWARLYMVHGRLQEADQYIRQSLDATRDLGLPNEEGMSLRTLGEIQAAFGLNADALSTLERSLAVLRALDPPDQYQVARTQVVVSKVLKNEYGQALLCDAYAAFQYLGARHDSAVVGNLMKSVIWNSG